MSLFTSSRPRRPTYRPSLECLETRDCPSVAAPTGMQLAAVSSTQVKVTWNDVANETGYRVYEWDGSQSVMVGQLSRNTTSLTVGQLAPNQRYYFLVEAFDASTYARTAWDSIRTPVDAVTAPANVRVGNASLTTLSITWSDAINETGYRIFQWDGSRAVQIGTAAANAVNYQVSNLSPGNVYYFYVQAFNATNFASSDWVSGSTQANSLTAPGNLSTQVIGSDKIQLNWNDANGETGYRVYRWDGSANNPVLLATLGANATSYQSTGLQFGTQYWYYVQSFNAANTVANSPWVTATTPANLQLVAPANFTIAATGQTSALLSWDDSAGAAGYRVYYWLGTQWSLVAVVQPGVEQLQFNNLPTFRTHWFLIQAYTANNVQVANTAPMFVNL